MVKTKSLEEYLKSYFRSTNLENGPMSYATYKTERGSDGASGYQWAMSEAGLAAMQASPDYGSVAEELRQKGLGASGYRDYLTRVGSESLAATEQRLKREMDDIEHSNVQGYLSYLSDYGEEQQRIGRKVSDVLIRRGITDSDSAYNYAIQNGLSPDMANQVVSSSYGVIRQRLIDEIINKIATMELDKEGAEIYARHMGLSEEDASLIGRAADELYDHYVGISDDYFDFLEELEELGGHTHGKYIKLEK